MVRIAICGVASRLMLGRRLPNARPFPRLRREQPDSRTALGVEQYLAAGAEALRIKEDDQGIRLTKIGLERPDVAARPRSRAV